MTTEHPILMTGFSVRAYLAGRKTQTRRVINPQPPCSLSQIENTDLWTYTLCDDEWKCPYGCPGDNLWWREAWCPVVDPFVGGAVAGIGYKADKQWATIKEPRGKFKDGWTCFNWDKPEAWKFRPPIHMPRWACRIVTPITSIRVERLHDISESDCEDEGLMAHEPVGGHAGTLWSADDIQGTDAKEVYLELWDRMYGKKYPAASNPFLWVISFANYYA